MGILTYNQEKKICTYIFIYVGVFFIVNTLIKYFSVNAFSFLGTFEFKIIYNFINIFICILFIRVLAIKKRFYLKYNLFYIPFCLACVVINFWNINKRLKAINDKTSTDLFVYLLKCISTGFFEELLIRLLVFYALIVLLRRNTNVTYWPVIFFASFIFGVLHISNILIYDTESLVTQIISAVVIGILLESLLIRLNNIFVIGTLHALINFNGMVNYYFFESDDGKNNISDLSYDFSDYLFQVILIIIIIFVSYCLVRKKDVYKELNIKSNHQYL